MIFQLNIFVLLSCNQFQSDTFFWLLSFTSLMEAAKSYVTIVNFPVDGCFDMIVYYNTKTYMDIFWHVYVIH